MNKDLTMGLNEINKRLTVNNQKLLYLILSGSHAWGLERPDSDYDLRGIYQDPTTKILDLHRGKDTIDFTEGLYDVQLYEIGKFLTMLSNHNGNMVTLLRLPNLYNSPEINWQELGAHFITKKLRHYYRGYAESQRKRALSQRGGKALIYTYREMFSGLFLMKYGSMIFDFEALWEYAEQNGWYNDGLLYKCYVNTTMPISDDEWTKFYGEWEELSNKLDVEADKSSLPDTYDGYELCNTILQKLRKDEYIKQ